MKKSQIIGQFLDDGYVVVPGLFDADEIEAMRAHFMELNRQGQGYECDRDTLLGDDDPLKAYPRLVHPHRADDFSRDWLLDDRLRYWTTALLGREPYAAQTMFYFKPPGARGQALHQDQKSLRVKPGTCLAAWLAVDDCDEENGCMQIVPRTQDLPQLCLIEADLSQSFSSKTVPIPPGSKPRAGGDARGRCVVLQWASHSRQLPQPQRDALPPRLDCALCGWRSAEGRRVLSSAADL